MTRSNPMLDNVLSQLRGSPGDPMTSNYGFAYAVDFAAVAFGSTVSQALRIDAGTDFIVQRIACSANFSVAGQPTGWPIRGKLLRTMTDGIVTATPEAGNAFLSQILLQFGVSDRQYSNIALRADLITCEPGYPNDLPTPFYCPAGDSLQITLQNNLPALTGLAAPAIDVQLQFQGVKLAKSR